MSIESTTSQLVTRLEIDQLGACGDENVTDDSKHQGQITLEYSESDIGLTTTFDLATFLFGAAVPRALDYEIILLKRKQDTLDMHGRFSASPEEGENKVLDRISVARKEARKIQAYTCITEYIFAEPRIDVHFFYSGFLKETKAATNNPKFIDVGCCVGTDIRKIIYDGYPSSNITGLDRESQFYNIGLSLFNQTQQGLGIRFIQADVLSANFYSRYAQLAGQFDYVHSANVIHLFDAETQHSFTQALAFLAKPGGTIWGRQVGERDDSATRGLKIDGKGHRFTANEFRKMWLDATGWDQKEFEFKSRLVRYEEMRLLPEYKRNSLEWVVKVPISAALDLKQPHSSRVAEVEVISK